jgi:RND family efflux transporter MFP subunit
MKRIILPFFAILVVAASISALVFKIRWKTASAQAAVVKPATAPELDVPALPGAEDEGWIGVLVPPDAADLAARVEGKLIDVKVKVGDRVKRDKLLAQFDTRVMKHELAAAQAAYAASADRAKRRNGTINVGGTAVSIVSEEDKSNSQYDTSAAAARVEQLRAALELAEVRAPFDGVVTTLYTGVGNYLRAGVPVLRLIGDSTIRLRFAVPDEATNRPPLKSRVVVRLKDGRKLNGTVESISAEVDPASHCVFVDARIDDLPANCGDSCNQLAQRAVVVTPAQTNGEMPAPQQPLSPQPATAAAPK